MQQCFLRRGLVKFTRGLFFWVKFELKKCRDFCAFVSSYMQYYTRSPFSVNHLKTFPSYFSNPYNIFGLFSLTIKYFSAFFSRHQTFFCLYSLIILYNSFCLFYLHKNVSAYFLKNSFCLFSLTTKHLITKFKVLEYNYFLSNFSVHIFKSVGYRKLANVHKSMQIRKPVVTNIFFFKCLSYFFGKMSLPQTVYFSISNF